MTGPYSGGRLFFAAVAVAVLAFLAGCSSSGHSAAGTGDTLLHPLQSGPGTPTSNATSPASSPPSGATIRETDLTYLTQIPLKNDQGYTLTATLMRGALRHATPGLS